MPIRRLVRSRAHAKVAGVCAGLADYFGVDVVLVRTAWVVLSVVPGAVVGGVIAYAAAWLLIPEATAESETLPEGRRLTRSANDARIAGVCGGIAEYFGVDSTAVRLLWVFLSIFGGAVVGGVIAYAFAWLIMPRQSDGIVKAATPAEV
jgi:phage shock protein C